MGADKFSGSRNAANFKNSHRVNPRPRTPLRTIRALARSLSVSPTTVSEALRGVPRVSAATARRVRAAAERHGYRCNPIAGAVMAELRRSHQARYRGTLAVIELDEPERTPGRRFSDELRRGAVERGHELGFTLDHFLLGEKHLAPTRLNAILANRGIVGVLVLPSYREAHLEQIDWARLTAIYLDRVIRFPPLHSVSTDHHAAVWTALAQLEEAGYRRAGLVLQRQQDYRLQNRWEGACHAYAQQTRQLSLAPMLVAPEITEEMFNAWFRSHGVDVVLGHSTRYIDWMERAGAQLPRTHGFLALNAAMCERPCAAIDQQPRLIGARAVEMVVGQLLRGEIGLPANPCNTSVPARLALGLTLRAEPTGRRGSARNASGRVRCTNGTEN